MTWSKTKLEYLREKFSGSNSGDIHDEHFKEIANHISGKGGYRTAPYAGISTFLNAPVIAPSEDSFTELQVAISGMPMDMGVTNRSGARFGPRALRTIEVVGPYNDGLRVAPVQEMRVADVGDVPFSSRYDLHQSHAEIETFIGNIVKNGTLPLSVGGDHSISHPILKAVGRERPVGMLHLDAHCDTGGPIGGERFHHGGPFRNAVLDGVLDPERTIQIGIRGSTEYIWEFSKASGMTVVYAHEFQQRPITSIIQQAKDVLQDGPVYISFDVDSLDPAFAPGTGTPETAGLTPREVQTLLRGLKGLNVVGGDVTEVSPNYDPTSNTAQNGAQALFEILSLMYFSPSLK
ncbi:agmatinase [Candidatus Endobugula sertula]|uniref:Agmatinase n=1 Tax=Candidatus Endobugula sertula TaxID=62101 RepID=A0A1D2QMA1_9GAMM|nr:agmatinase [Candidatus Endobugula sertula]